MSTERRVIESTFDPLDYPWAPAEHNGLMTRDGYLRLQWRQGRRLGKARLDGSDCTSVGRYLTERSNAVAESRYLVLAVGSNMSPMVMRNKFSRRGTDTSQILPFVRARLHGVAIGFYADAAPRGYIAATPYDSPGAESIVQASWLDPGQMAALDSTEPGYACSRLSSQEYRLELLDDDGDVMEVPESFYLYEATAGIIAPNGVPLPFGSQTDCYAALAAQVPALAEVFGGSAEEASVWLREAGHREIFRRTLREAGAVVQRPLRGEPETSIADRRTYGETPRLFPDLGGPRVVPTLAATVRSGQNVVVAHPSDVVGLGDTVEVRAQWAPDRPGLLAELQQDVTVARGEIRVDQMVRDAIGVDAQDTVALRAAKLSGSRNLANRIIRPQYLPLRVHAADHRNGELPVVLMDPLAMEFMGVSNGDFVVIEGSPGEDGVVPTIRVRAVGITADIAERRARASGGLSARYPSAEEALGVYPDIADVWMDLTLRSRLNLGSNRLAPVRARASRRDKILSELRELLLVVALGFLGLTTIFESKAFVIGGALAIVLFTAILSIWRVRARLGLAKLAAPPKLLP